MEASVIPSLTELPPVLSTLALRPHSGGAVFNCVTCHQPCARWRIRHERYGPEDTDICALCFLYSSGWLVGERSRRVEQVVQVISLKRQKLMEMVVDLHQPRGRLVHVNDADDVLGAITLHDRFERVISMKRRSA